MPKVTKLSQEQMDDFLAEIMASNISEKAPNLPRCSSMAMPGWPGSWSLGSSVFRSCASYFKFKAAKNVQVENLKATRLHPIIKAMAHQRGYKRPWAQWRWCLSRCGYCWSSSSWIKSWWHLSGWGMWWSFVWNERARDICARYRRTLSQRYAL